MNVCTYFHTGLEFITGGAANRRHVQAVAAPSAGSPTDRRGAVRMGHRALVARQGPDGRYDLYYAHWGGADLSLARRLADSPDPGESPTQPADPGISDDPLAVGVDRDELFADHLDPLVHEALFVVDDDVTAYRPLWFGPVDGGAVVGVDPWAACDDERVRAWFEGTRDAVADLLATGAVTEDAAARCLRRRVRSWAADREVLFP